MPVPKKRVGHSDQGHRRSNWKATIPTVTTCPNCGSFQLTHRICGTCGFYKGRIVSTRFQKEETAEES
jgi:large subunit ribosomal protein L32